MKRYKDHMIFTDAHCHLGSRQFDQDRQLMMDRMMKEKVRKAIMICCSRHDLSICLELSKLYPDLKLALAIHPQDLEDDHQEERLERLERIIDEVRPDMIGETGLDYYSHPHTKQFQKHFFEAQLKMAQDRDLPVNIHSRQAAKDTLDTLMKYKVRGIIHSYSGSVEMADLYLKQGYYLSFGASVLFKGAKKPAEVIRHIPIERLLIETDAPYQSPIKDHRHEPSDVIRIYEAIAAIKEIALEDLCDTVEANFDNVFR
ncbi:MAG: TatD family hydrolase [Erysipelotrichaceae bacterium]|nr:TatD family hydrolase [Erysipelotrichaceae bacterium]